MKHIWLHTVRAYVRLGLYFYYKRVRVVRQAPIPKQAPIIFLSNHQNALVDALLIATTSTRFTYFLTRASVFKHPIVAKLLSSVQMLPVFRVRDGWQTIKNNHNTFDHCVALLGQNKTVSLFPEGNHNIKRTVRPLSKGFTRIVLDTLKAHPNLELKLVPVGLNYREGTRFPDAVTLMYGKAIEVRELLKTETNDQKASMLLKQNVQEALKTLTTHIAPEHYETHLQHLHEQQADFFYPEHLNASLASGGVTYTGPTYKRSFGMLRGVFKRLLIFNLWLPFLVWRYKVLPKIKEVEFIATFRFALAITLVPLWLLLVACIVGAVFGWAFGAWYLGASLALALLYVKM